MHTVPSLGVGYPLFRSVPYSFVGTAWAGYLPLTRQMSKTMEIDVSLRQYLAGVGVEGVFRIEKISLAGSVGFQYGHAALKGAITSTGANDEFDSVNQLVYFSQSMRLNSMPMWDNIMFLNRDVRTKFRIDAEKTEFLRNDSQTKSRFPTAAQATLGVILSDEIQIFSSIYHVENRLTFPRFGLVYQYRFAERKENHSKISKGDGETAISGGFSDENKI